jgi:hypothetical protein
VSQSANPMRARWIAVARFAGVLAVTVWVAACQQPSKPRTYEFFMEDGLAREGVLARCNQDRKAVEDQECENARRAAAAVGATGEHERTESYERESSRKLEQLRDRAARQQQAEEQAAAAAKAAEKEAYEAQWRDKDAAGQAGGPGPISDASIGADERESLSQLPARPELKIAAVEPPKADIQPQKPEIEHAAVIPRPFRDSSLQR